MSRKSFARKRLYPVAFMLAVTLVFVSVTSVVYTFTGDRIALNERLMLKQAVLYAAGSDMPDDPAGIEEVFDRRVTEVRNDSGEVSYYEIRGEGSGKVDSYVVIFTGAGLWGDIEASVGIGDELVYCRGLEIIYQNETPGLGGRIAETWFKEQFRGKRFPLIAVSEEGSSTDSEFHGITGATYSTEAIEDIMNSAIEYARREILPNGDEGK